VKTHTKKEDGAMKILKIENGVGYFLATENNDWKLIDKIDKNGILFLLNKFLDEEVEMDSMEDVQLSNQAHSIIYSNLFNKLTLLSENKTRFKDESERTYLEEIKKYSQA